MPVPVITLLTDYGLADEFVGVCHGVIAGICPGARVIDLTHGIPRHDIRAGAVILADSLRFLPAGIHVAVVDPGVGSRRRAVALALAAGRILVGPDNGVLSLAAQAGGGVAGAVEISESPLRLEPVSATFHGRDIFAPVAAHLAAGVPLGEAGVPFDPDTLHGIELPPPAVEHGRLTATVLGADVFGNVQLAATSAEVEALGVRVGGRVQLHRVGAGRAHAARFAESFADVATGELFIYEDASRRLALAVARGSAAAELGLAAGDEVAMIRATAG